MSDINQVIMFQAHKLTQAEILVIVIEVAKNIQTEEPIKAIILNAIFALYRSHMMQDLVRDKLNSVVNSILDENHASTAQWEALARTMLGG